MATLNIYSYSSVELQKHFVYPQFSQQMTHLKYVGILWQTASFNWTRVDVYVALVLFC